MLSYRELMRRTDAPPGSAWGLHGSNDQIGTINFITPESVKHAASLVRKGMTFNLDCALDAFTLPHRPKIKHVIHGKEQHFTRDDYVDNFYLQSSTQVDGLRHFRHPVHGFYNFTRAEDVKVGAGRLGIEHYAERAIAGRGVLLDIERYLASNDKTLDLENGEAFGIDLLEAVAKAENVSFRPGDILMLRTGWLNAYFHKFDQTQRGRLAARIAAPGLAQSHESLEWLWDHQFSIIAADTPGFEAVPPVPTSPFPELLKGVDGLSPRMAAMMHPFLIAMLGFCLGELWNLDGLAQDCAADGAYDMMVTVKPLNLPGGVGSPANVIAIK